MKYYIYAYYKDAPEWPYYWGGADDHWHVESEMASLYDNEEEAQAVLATVRGDEIMSSSGVGTVPTEGVEKKIDKLLEQDAEHSSATWTIEYFFPTDKHKRIVRGFRSPQEAYDWARAENIVGETGNGEEVFIIDDKTLEVIDVENDNFFSST
jgi:hypothetical protein